jgi:short chain dehydrogenase
VVATNEPDELKAVGEEMAPSSAKPTAIRGLGRESLEIEVNIRDGGSVEAMRDAVLERFGAADFVINNAGGQFQAHPLAISDNGWRAVIDLNLNGTWNVCSRFIPHLMARGRGSIVNIVHIFCFERGAPIVRQLRRRPRRRHQPDTQPGAVPRTTRRDDQCAGPWHHGEPGGRRQLRIHGGRMASPAEPITVRRSRGHGGDHPVPLLTGGMDAQRQRHRRRRRRSLAIQLPRSELG